MVFLRCCRKIAITFTPAASAAITLLQLRVLRCGFFQDGDEERLSFIMARSPMPGYYTERLAAARLRACDHLAPPRTKAYLEAEIEFVLAKTTPSMLALELGI